MQTAPPWVTQLFDGGNFSTFYLKHARELSLGALPSLPPNVLWKLQLSSSPHAFACKDGPKLDYVKKHAVSLRFKQKMAFSKVLVGLHIGSEMHQDAKYEPYM